MAAWRGRRAAPLAAAVLRVALLAGVSFLVPVRAQVHAEKAAFVVDLTAATFNSTLDTTPSNAYLLVKFFAPWCPHCQRFRPQYERVAALFNTEPRTSPVIVIAAVDCVEQETLCTKFNIREYPTLWFGPPKGFMGDAHALHKFRDASTAENVVKEINERLGTDFVLSTDTTYGHTYKTQGEVVGSAHAAADAAEASQVSLRDVEKATVLAVEYMHSSQLLVPHNRRAFVSWVRLLASAHPVPRCRAGSQHLLDSLEDVWPSRAANASAAAPSMQLRRWRVCGRHAVQHDWEACKGSGPTTRGYSCGLWALLHALAATPGAHPDGAPLPEERVGADWMKGVTAFVSTFFACSACRDHFMEMASTHAATKVSSRREAVLWMWEAHNQVNARLAVEERETETGDPAFPKMQWPTAEACPPCRNHHTVHTDQASADKPDWDVDAVYAYNLYFYGNGSRPKGVPSTVPRAATTARAAAAAAGGSGRAGGAVTLQDLGAGGTVALSGLGLVLCAYWWFKSVRSLKARKAAARAAS